MSIASHNISRLHYITQEVAGTSTADLVKQACEGGVKWVQLRIKNQSQQYIYNTAVEVKEICRKYGAVLIINDHVSIAKKVNADGVHLGKEDLDPQSARELLGPKKIIGGTANTIEDVMHLSSAGVDYIGLGPYRFTSTKEKLSPVLGIEGVKYIIEKYKGASVSSIPTVLIGGIKHADLPEIFLSGIYGIAVSSGINQAENRTQAALEFTTQIKMIFKE